MKRQILQYLLLCGAAFGLWIVWGCNPPGTKSVSSPPDTAGISPRPTDMPPDSVTLDEKGSFIGIKGRFQNVKFGEGQPRAFDATGTMLWDKPDGVCGELIPIGTLLSVDTVVDGWTSVDWKGFPYWVKSGDIYYGELPDSSVLNALSLEDLHGRYFAGYGKYDHQEGEMYWEESILDAPISYESAYQLLKLSLEPIEREAMPHHLPQSTFYRKLPDFRLTIERAFPDKGYVIEFSWDGGVTRGQILQTGYGTSIISSHSAD